MAAGSLPIPVAWVDDAMASCVPFAAAYCREHGLDPDDPAVAKTVEKVLARVRAELDQARLVFPCCGGR